MKSGSGGGGGKEEIGIYIAFSLLINRNYTPKFCCVAAGNIEYQSDGEIEMTSLK